MLAVCSNRTDLYISQVRGFSTTYCTCVTANPVMQHFACHVAVVVTTSAVKVSCISTSTRRRRILHGSVALLAAQFEAFTALMGAQPAQTPEQADLLGTSVRAADASCLNAPITADELHDCIKRLKRNKFRGLDRGRPGIFPSQLETLSTGQPYF